MVDKKISALTAATTPLAGTEVLPIVQSGATVKVAVSDLTAGRSVAASALAVDANSATTAVRITQTGAGNALLVEDSASTDTTPFVITAAGDVGVGLASPSYKMHVEQNVNSPASIGIGNTTAGTSSVARLIAVSDAGSGTFGFTSSSYTDITDAQDALLLNTTNASGGMAFALEGTVQMKLTSTGLGVGLASPSYKIHAGQNVNGAATVGVTNTTAGASSLARFIAISNAGNGAFGFTSSSYTDITNAQDALLIAASNASGGIVMALDGVAKTILNSNGEFIVGTTDNGAYNLQCNGTGVWGAGAYVNGSDARLKEDVADLSPSLDIVTSLRPITFRYKADYSRDTNIQPGFIAQELKTALAGTNYADGVVLEGTEYLNVAYQNLIPLLTKAIQELKTELDAVKDRIAILENA